ncbi:MAG: VOC family protein [Bacteroidia bacterium]
MGIGVPNVHEAWAWYRKNFGMDVPVFEEAATAELMLKYTGGQPHDRHAILAINMQGGGGFEIWQYTSRTPEGPKQSIKLGDLGIYACKLKARDVPKAFKEFDPEYRVSDKVHVAPNGDQHFFVKDPYGNMFQIVECPEVYMETKSNIGGVYGAIIGCSNILRSAMYYDAILNYLFTKEECDAKGKHQDLYDLPNGDATIHRCIMPARDDRAGGFSELLGPSQIEIIQLAEGESQANSIYEDRYWGDLGFIHLCFDVLNMPNLQAECLQGGFPFTVDSANTFDMGEAAGRFSYIEDPDGALIEFVETQKIPIMKKLGWYLDLTKRKDRLKPLPRMMLKALALNRKKN